MHAYQKDILKREQLVPMFSYPYKVIPLTEQAKLAFSLYNKHNGQLTMTRADLYEKYLKIDKFPFVGQMTFHYEDPMETEEIQKEMSKDLAIRNMAELFVPGICHKDILKSTYFVNLIENTDYKIEVGEKIIHEQLQTLTFNDIKTLQVSQNE